MDTAVENEAQSASPEKVAQKGRFSKLKRWQKILIVIAAIVVGLAIILALTVVIMLNVGKGELLDPNEDDQAYRTVEYQGMTYEYNDAMTTICVIGTDRLYGYVDPDNNGNADAILLLAYDTSSGAATLINAPRSLCLDYTIDVPDAGEWTFEDGYLATAYTLYTESDAEGSEQVCDALTGLFNGIPIKNYVTLLESAIGPLTEAMGGVTLTAIEDVPWVGVVKDETYTMKGDQALRYVQWRNIYQISSVGNRSMRQQQFANAFIHQTIEAAKKNPGVLLDMYRIITDPDYMTTNLDVSELAYLVSVALSQGLDQLDLVTIPYDDYYNEEIGMSEYYPREDDLQQLILEIYYTPAS